MIILLNSVLHKIDFLLKRHLKTPIFRAFCYAGRLLNPVTNKRIQKERISKVLVLQGGGLGDLIRIFPILRALKDEFPSASISIVSPFDHELFKLFPHLNIISDIVIIDVARKHKSLLSKLLFIRFLRKKSFDLIVSPQIGLGMVEFATLSFLIGAPYRIGYDGKGSGFLHTTKVELVENKSIYEQHGELLRSSGIRFPSIGYYSKEPYVRIPEEDLYFARSFLRDHGIVDGDFIFTISPTVIADRDSKSPQHNRSLAESRTWPEQNYVDLVNQIIHSYRAKVILLGDAIPVGNLSEFLKNAENPDLISAMGQTTIGQAAALINLSDIFITNDSGLLHVAIALKKRCVGIFGSTSPKQVVGSVDSCIPVWKGLQCSPCWVHQPIHDFNCPYDLECLKSITVEDVMKAIKYLLPT